MRKFLFNTHLLIALAAGAFIVTLGITGSIMAFEPEVDHLFHSKRSYVVPTGSAHSLGEIGAVASRAVPGQRITAYRTSTSPDISWQVLFESNTVYIDQYTGEVLGVYGDGPEFLDYVHQLHLRLLWQGRGSPGERIIAWSGVAMLLLIISGLYLWWPFKRFTLTRGVTGRRWWLEFHNACGIFSVIFLLLLCVTGVVIGLTT